MLREKREVEIFKESARKQETEEETGKREVEEKIWARGGCGRQSHDIERSEKWGEMEKGGGEIWDKENGEGSGMKQQEVGGWQKTWGYKTIYRTTLSIQLNSVLFM